MKVLHTSDWHLGRSLYGRKRYDEFSEFLNWLANTIDQAQVDVLLVAGDVFDTSTPSNRAQALYYQFLCGIAESSCRHVIVIAGNHDSPSFLNAPKDLLRVLNVHVVGAITENIEDEVILLKDEGGSPELIVCAVPYLRDRDMRVAEAGESIGDKERKLVEGIRSHYAEVCGLAEQKREVLGIDIPIVAMGHIFAAGGKTLDGDGVRELYVGSLAHVTSKIFPQNIDYLALGHLHVPQKLNGSDIMRYSGSPLPMGFGEAKQEKIVCIIEFSDRNAKVTVNTIPVFQKLERIKGDFEKISSRVLALVNLQYQTWLEIIYDGEEIIPDLRERLELLITDSQIEILRVKNTRVIERVLNRIIDDATLDDLNEKEVFERCLEVNEVPEEQRDELLHAYQEIISTLHNEDVKAE